MSTVLDVLFAVYDVPTRHGELTVAGIDREELPDPEEERPLEDLEALITQILVHRGEAGRHLPPYTGETLGHLLAHTGKTLRQFLAPSGETNGDLLTGGW